MSRGGAKIAVQAKRWNRKIGNKAIQEVVASAGHYRCQQSMVVTNSFFTKPAIELARDNKVELWDRNRLVSALLEAREKRELTLHRRSPPKARPRTTRTMA